MKKKIIAAVSTVVAIAILIVCLVLYNTHYKSKGSGTIEVYVINLESTVVSQKEIEFEKGDSLIALFEENYDDVVITDGFLYSIAGYDTPSDWSWFFCIYVDGEMSQVGLADIKFKDGTKIELKMTRYETGS